VFSVLVAAGSWAAPSGATPGAGGSAVRGVEVSRVVAAGDIACDPEDPSFNLGLGTDDRCRMLATSDLWFGDASIDAVLALGDLQYEDGSLSQFLASFDPSWGRDSGRIYPTPGNHEYRTANAQGYFDYWGERAGPDQSRSWYAFDLGSWHVISLNSTCSAVDCGPDSPQGEWLRRDLRRSAAGCTLAFFHYPLVASSISGVMRFPVVKSFWKALHRRGADVILVGHHHAYERFAPMTPSLERSPDGIRQFVVGTGGKNVAPQNVIAPNSQRRVRRLGVLDLELGDGAYTWRFRSIDGAVRDEGSDTCV
jgi:hypothetical protein